MLTTIGGVEQILVFAASRLVGLSVDGGRLRNAAEMAAFDLRVAK